MRSVFARGPTRLEAALTPLIDITMLLIVFFVLVSQIGVKDQVPMRLPRPAPSAAVPPGREPRVVVNAIADGAGGVSVWRFAGVEYAPTEAGLQALGGAVAAGLRAQPALEVNLRADAAMRYEAIAPAIDAIGRAAAKAVPGSPTRLRVAVRPEDARE